MGDGISSRTPCRESSPEDGTPSSRPSPSARAPIGLAVTPGAVWVANHWAKPGDRTGSAMRIDPATNTIVDTIPLGAAPFDGPKFVAAAAGSIWVGVPNLEAVVRLSTATDDVQATIPDKGSCSGIAATDAAVWVAGGNGPGCAPGVTRIDPATNKVVGGKLNAGGNVADVAVGLGSVWFTTFRGGGEPVRRTDRPGHEHRRLATQDGRLPDRRRRRLRLHLGARPRTRPRAAAPTGVTSPTTQRGTTMQRLMITTGVAIVALAAVGTAGAGVRRLRRGPRFHRSITNYLRCPGFAVQGEFDIDRTTTIFYDNAGAAVRMVQHVHSDQDTRQPAYGRLAGRLGRLQGHRRPHHGRAHLRRQGERRDGPRRGRRLPGRRPASPSSPTGASSRVGRTTTSTTTTASSATTSQARRRKGTTCRRTR